ncbi:hypothetical protein FOCC_FOCC000027 [Frankliniella occidentalis]|nr:hypothetical protein FOCC_FOCC000027 [Frankliniella occidentalis]
MSRGAEDEEVRSIRSTPACRMTKSSISIAHPEAPDAPKCKAATVEEATELLGSGLFHWVLVVATGMCSASAVFEAMCPSYLFSPAAWATCDLDLEDADKSLLSAIVFAGMLTGTLLWGVAADSWGRVPLLRLTLLGDAAMGVVSSLAPDKRLFIAARVAGPTSTAMAYLGEFHSERTRSRAMVIFGVFPGGASLAVAALAYLVLPLDLAWSLPWLHTVSGKEYPVTSLVTPLENTSAGGGGLLGLVRQTARLFGKEHVRNTLILCTVLFVVVSSANGLLVWMPEIFNSVATFSKLEPDTPATACQAIYGLRELAVNSSAVAAAAADATARPPGRQVCGGVLEDAMFINTGIIGMSNVAVGLLSIVAIGILGKKMLLDWRHGLDSLKLDMDASELMP